MFHFRRPQHCHASACGNDAAHRREPGERGRWSQRAVSALFWLGLALALAGIGYAIGRAMESWLLGFLGADFLFIIAVSIYASGQGGSGRDRA